MDENCSANQLVDQEQAVFLKLPKELILIISKAASKYDALMLRTTCKSGSQIITIASLFPKYFVLNQSECLKYYAAIGSISALQYLQQMKFDFKTAEFDLDLSAIAAAHGHVNVLKFLAKNRCTINYWDEVPAEAK